MIELQSVHKSFGELEVLRDVTLSIGEGEIVSVLGSSGSGKSTLIRCINGLEGLSGGKILVDGLDVSKPRELAESRKRSATVFQQFNLYPHMTALDNITLAPIEVLRTNRDAAEREARTLLDRVGLADKTDVYPAQLSGGQKQRVAICRALAMSPRYLLLDEITSALDPEMTSEVLDILAKLAREASTTMVFVTHEIAFAEQMSSRVIFLDEGRVAADYPKEQFFSESGGLANPRVKQFLSKIRLSGQYAK